MGFLSSSDEAQDYVSGIQDVSVDPALLAQQQQFTDAIRAQSQGAGPSLATQMLQQQAQQNAMNAAAMAASQRGVNAGLAQRNALNAAGQANAQAAQQGAMARTQEQLNAQGLLGQQLNTLQNQNMAAQQANQNKATNAAQIQANAASQDASTNAGLLGGALQAGGSAAAMLSDERQKTDIQDGSGDAYAFLENLNPSRYVYKDPSLPGAAPGEQLGVMAQDVESGAPQAVIDTPNGKMIDPSKAVGPQLAALGDLHQRLKRLEEGTKVRMAQGGMAGDPGVIASQMVDPRSLARAPQPYQAVNMTPKMPSQAAPQAASAGAPASALGASLSVPAFSHGGSVARVVPGKAKVKGDSVKNDVVDAKLSPGEIVLPRTVVNSKDPGKKAMEFVNAILAKSSMKSKSSK